MLTVSEFKKTIRQQTDLSSLFLAEMTRHTKALLNGMEQEFRFHNIRKWRFDFAWPESFVAVECDGGQYKAFGGRHNTDKDRDKLNGAAMLGWRVLRFSGAQIKGDPIGCLDKVYESILYEEMKQVKRTLEKLKGGENG